MKVLRKKRRPWVQVFDCVKCDAKLEVSETDCQVRQDRDGMAYEFKCPECGHANWVAAGAILGGGRGPREPR